jgi:hypothetical protein
MRSGRLFTGRIHQSSISIAGRLLPINNAPNARSHDL